MTLRSRTIAITQPYFLPYLGYWQLLHAADTIVLLDDAAFMPRGWVNRNRILASRKEFLFTIPVLGSSQNRRICDIQRDTGSRVIPKLLKTLEQSYRRAPHWTEAFPLVEACLALPQANLADFIAASISLTLDALGISREIKRSSSSYSHLASKGEQRILEICAEESASCYLNLPGGLNLYSDSSFASKGVDLRFLKPVLRPYAQQSDSFVAGLSIIDVLLNMGIEGTREQVRSVEIERP